MPSHTNRFTIEEFEDDDGNCSYRIYDEQRENEECGMCFREMLRSLIKRCA